MARRPRHAPLKVCLNGRLVGHLRRQASGAIDFRYDPDWLAWEHALPVSFSLPLREDRYIGAPVIAVFDNLLPDNDRIRQRMAERMHAAGTDAYSLLSSAGRDCVGALQFLPADLDPGPLGALDGTPVSEEAIRTLLDNLADTPLGLSESDDFRISIAGAQEKPALLRVDGRWLKPRGTTATTHILKPPIGPTKGHLDLSDSVENEWLSLALVRAMGLLAAKAEMAAFAGRKALVVERFDRLWTDETPSRLLRLPQEDCCQALGVPPMAKYESEGGPGIGRILELLKASDRPAEDCRAFLKTQIVFWLMAASDGHAKNFSLLLSAGGRFRLAPLYDVMSAEPYSRSRQLDGQKLKLAMAVGDNRHYEIEEIVPRHFTQTGVKYGLAKTQVEEILDEVGKAAPKAIDTVMAALPASVPTSTAESIIEGMRKRLKLIEGRSKV